MLDAFLRLTDGPQAPEVFRMGPSSRMHAFEEDTVVACATTIASLFLVEKH